MPKERWAQIAITIEFLIVVRTLGEFFRLRHALGANFSTALTASYIGGALLATCFCWASVISYFSRRHMLAAWLALADTLVLLIYKITFIAR